MVDSIASIDLSFLQSEFGDDPQFIAEILQDFVTSMDGHLSVLQLAVADNDLSQVMSESHQLKASSATIGASVLSNLAVDMETFARSQSGEGDLPGTLDSLVNQSEKVRLAVRAYCSTHNTLH